MEILMRRKSLLKVTMETEVEPNATAENIKWKKRRDEAYGLLCLIIFGDLIFPSRWIDITKWSMGETPNLICKYNWNEGTFTREWDFITESKQFQFLTSLLLQVKISYYLVNAMWHWKEILATSLGYPFEAWTWLFSVCIDLPYNKIDSSKLEYSFTCRVHGILDLGER